MNQRTDPQQLAAVFLTGLAGHPDEFGALAALWTRGPTLSLSPLYRGDLSISAQARHVAELAEDAGFDRFVAIGHSQGGLVGLELAVTRPDVVAAVAVLDSPVLVPRPVRIALRMFVALLHTPVGPALLRLFFRATFVEADRLEQRAAVMRRLDRVPRAAARRIVGAAFGYDAAGALTKVEVPVSYVKANVPTRLDRLPARVEGYEVADSGHWVHVHHPHEVGTILGQLASRVESAVEANDEQSVADA
ncbi:alpha/beta fold hydrolase [Nocardia sp. NPDC058658]|uniref:alpha/beta fold hydrolase n=1 Tax=Nocardia sp. NPDC058658 TaxID=3346580 RepID=UPI00365AE558